MTENMTAEALRQCAQRKCIDCPCLTDDVATEEECRYTFFMGFADTIDRLTAENAEARESCDITDAANVALHGALQVSEAENARLTERLAAAVEDINCMAINLPLGLDCYYCKHYTHARGGGKCVNDCHFQWRGEENE